MILVQLFAVEVNGPGWWLLILAVLSTNFLKHWHVVVLILHTRSTFSIMLCELIVWDAPRHRSNIFLRRLAWQTTFADFLIVLSTHHMWSRAFNFFPLTNMIITWEGWLVVWNYAHWWINVIFRGMVVHSIMMFAKWLGFYISIWSLVNALAWRNFVLHRGAYASFRTLRPLIFHWLHLILTSELVKVAISIADLVSVRCISGHPIRWVFFALSIEDIFCWT